VNQSRQARPRPQGNTDAASQARRIRRPIRLQTTTAVVWPPQLSAAGNHCPRPTSSGELRQGQSSHDQVVPQQGRSQSGRVLHNQHAKSNRIVNADTGPDGVRDFNTHRRSDVSLCCCGFHGLLLYIWHHRCYRRTFVFSSCISTPKALSPASRIVVQ